MSFGPKKASRKASPETAKKLGNSYLNENFPLSAQGKNNSQSQILLDPDLSSRIEMLESNLSRISTQQDALLPLMNMLEIAPTMTRNENLLKNLHKKGQETEDRISRLEQMVRGYQQNIETTISRIGSLNSAPKVVQADTSLLEKSLKDVSNQITKQSTAVKEVENNLGQMQKTIETKVTETTTNSSRALELRLERQRGEFSSALNDFSKDIDLTFKKFEDAVKDLYSQVTYREGIVYNINRQKSLKNLLKGIVDRRSWMILEKLFPLSSKNSLTFSMKSMTGILTIFIE